MKKTLSAILAALLIMSMIPFTVLAAEVPVFSLNITEETDSTVTLVVNLESGGFKAVDLRVEAASDKIGSCIYAVETDEYLDFIKSVKRSGGTGSSGANTDNGYFSTAVTSSYSGGSIIEYSFKKNSSDKVTESDIRLKVTSCENGRGQLTPVIEWNGLKYKITYNANGGTVSPASENVESGKTVKLPTPVKAGYTCLGWAKTASASGAEYACGSSFGTTASVTLYAVWKANEYTVTFNANGGSVSTANKKVTYNSTYGTLPTPTRTGYVFAGWYTEANGGSKITADTKAAITANQTLYAHWNANEYTVTFNANSGSVSTASKKVAYNSAYGSLPTPTHTGYGFAGWYTEANGGSKVTEDTKVTLTANQTLYAHWNANEYTVTFNANGGSVSTASKKVTYNSTYGTLPTPTLTGSTFTGWYTEANGGSKIAADTKVALTANQTLYAHWTVNEYTVTFNANGGSVSPASQKAEYNKSVTLPTPVRNGYTCLGWAKTASASSAEYACGSSFSVTANSTLYAVWHKDIAAPVVTGSNVASTGKVKLTWNAVDGAVSYSVYRATKKDGNYTLKKEGITKTSFTNTSSTTGKTYYYKVVAVAADKTVSEYSNIVTRTVDLPRPEVTVSSVASSGKTKLTWNAVDGAKSYGVYRADSADGTYKLMKTTTSTSYINTSAAAGTKYYYKVKANASKTAANSAYSTYVARTCHCAAPVIATSNVASSGKVKVSWDAVSGAASYEIYRSTSKNGSYRLIKKTSSTNYTDTTASAGTKYYYKVKALGAKTEADSALSSAKARTCDLASPSVTTGRSSSGKPKLTWNAVSGAVSYKIYRSTSENGTFTLMKTTTSTSYTNTTAQSGKTYYYRVKAVSSNTDANSAYAAVKVSA